MTALMNIQTQYASLDDDLLAQQARADPEAFAALYRRHAVTDTITLGGELRAAHFSGSAA